MNRIDNVNNEKVFSIYNSKLNSIKFCFSGKLREFRRIKNQHKALTKAVEGKTPLAGKALAILSKG